LSNFNSISVRENSLKESLFKHFNTISQTVLDPTFLIEKFKWKSLSVKPNFNKRYVLIYQLKRTPHSLKIGKKIAEQLNIECVEITSTTLPFYKKNRFQCEK